MLIRPSKKQRSESCKTYYKTARDGRTYCLKKRTCVIADDCEWCDERPKREREEL